MSKEIQTRELLDCSKCYKCGTETIYLNGIKKTVAGISITLYKCNLGHYFQDSYSLGPYNTENKFRPPCPYKDKDDQTEHKIIIKQSSRNRYLCKTCKSSFTYHGNQDNNNDVPNNLITTMDNSDHVTNDNDLEATLSGINMTQQMNLAHNPQTLDNSLFNTNPIATATVNLLNQDNNFSQQINLNYNPQTLDNSLFDTNPITTATFNLLNQDNNFSQQINLNYDPQTLNNFLSNTNLISTETDNVLNQDNDFENSYFNDILTNFDDILTDFDNILATNNQNNDRVIYTNDNQIIHLENLQNQNITNNYLSFKVQHSALGVYECEFQQIPSEMWHFLTDHQLLHLIGHYQDTSEDCVGEIH